MTKDTGYLNATQASEVLNVSRDTVLRWMRRGQLPTFIDGVIYRVSRADLDAFIAERTRRRSA